MGKHLLSKGFTVRDSFVVLAYFTLLTLLIVAALNRGSDAPLLPLNSEIDSDFWVQFAFLVIIAVLAFVFIGFAVAYYKVRRGHWTLKDCAGVLMATFATALLCYVPISYFYEKGLAPRQKFHAHLQLFPNEIPETIPRDEDTIVIAFLGGSTTAWGKWTGQVGERLQTEFPRKTFVILNQGVQWYTVLHSLINYETNVRRVEPDIVVVMHAINDLELNADHSYYVNGSFRRDYGHHTGSLTRLARTRPLFDLIADVARNLFFWQEREVIDTDRFEGLPVFKGYYRRLVNLIRLDGSQPVIMAQPYLYKAEMTAAETEKIYMDNSNAMGPTAKWSIDTARRGMEQYVAAVRELSVSERVPLIDLEAVIPKDLSYLKDDCHYTKQGAELVAKYVSDGLAEVIRSRSDYSAQSHRVRSNDAWKGGPQQTLLKQ